MVNLTDPRPLTICWQCKGTGYIIPIGQMNKVEMCPRCEGERVVRD